ncbi:hypothetical protein [Lacrimispora sp.]|uniref:hypothetical protein n=1 Tax=Lacrimispora sp. TaxID=2719234 RepID=UPI0028B09FC6|nr:hypothetical protein [Lacrimispora sp.]
MDKMLVDMNKKELCEILIQYDKKRTIKQLMRLSKNIMVGQINSYREYNFHVENGGI